MSLRATLRPVVHKVRHRYANPDLRSARELVARLDAGPLDVLYLLDSTAFFVSPDDSDQRTLNQMVIDGLGPGVSVHSFGQAGYHPRLYRAFVDLLRHTDQRPVVVHSLWARSTWIPWAEHPMYARDQVTRTIQRAADRKGRPGRIWAPIAPPNDRSMAELDAKPFTTALGTRTIGEYRLPLKDPAAHGLDKQEWSRLAYAFHQTGRVEPDSPYLHAYTDLSRDLATLGCRVVTYHVPMPVEGTVARFGPEMAELAARNFDLVERAYAAGGADTIAVGGGTDFPLSAYLDPDDGVEHINEAGRIPFAERIAEAVKTQLRARSGTHPESRQPSEPS